MPTDIKIALTGIVGAIAVLIIFGSSLSTFGNPLGPSMISNATSLLFIVIVGGIIIAMLKFVR